MEIKDDLLLPSLDEELFLDDEYRPLNYDLYYLSILLKRVFDESHLREPLEYSTSSEKETLEFLEQLDSLLDEVVNESDNTGNLALLGSTTTDSEEQDLQLATPSLPSLGVIPSALLRLSLETR